MNVARAIQDALDEQICVDTLRQVMWGLRRAVDDMPMESRDYLAHYDIRPGDKYGARGDQTFK